MGGCLREECNKNQVVGNRIPQTAHDIKKRGPFRFSETSPPFGRQESLKRREK